MWWPALSEMVCLNIEDISGRYKADTGQALFLDYKKNSDHVYNISSK